MCFYVKVVIFEEQVLESTIMNHDYYKEVTTNLRELKIKLPERGKRFHSTSGQWVCTHSSFCEVFGQQSHSNTGAHSIGLRFGTHYVTYLFPRVKSVLKGFDFELVDTVKKKIADVL